MIIDLLVLASLIVTCGVLAASREPARQDLQRADHRLSDGDVSAIESGQRTITMSRRAGLAAGVLIPLAVQTIAGWSAQILILCAVDAVAVAVAVAVQGLHTAITHSRTAGAMQPAVGPSPSAGAALVRRWSVSSLIAFLAAAGLYGWIAASAGLLFGTAKARSTGCQLSFDRIPDGLYLATALVQSALVGLAWLATRTLLRVPGDVVGAELQRIRVRMVLGTLASGCLLQAGFLLLGADSAWQYPCRESFAWVDRLLAAGAYNLLLVGVVTLWRYGVRWRPRYRSSTPRVGR